jgi:hypothetical protein
MFIIKKLEQYNENYVYFCEPIKNNIVQDGIFIRILYSSPEVVFNGIYLEFSLYDIYFEKYYNKYKCTFNVTHNGNKELIEKIRIMEENLLKKYMLPGKVSHFKIYEHIRNGNIKIFCDNIPKNNSILVLKISGIWETVTNYGLTYKFINFNP